ncbi:heterokaryon incompatibility protein-domain-containing protein [Apiospora marii]|uniref:heterokaryon incompatibility protein-domain-containing protein n=1 Tax=Apiospora marii TaxID=335849 RepID=UPI0031307168
MAFGEGKDDLEPDSSIGYPRRIEQFARDAVPTENTGNASSTEDALCDECRKLNLSEILKEANALSYYTRENEYRSRHANVTTCPLCRMLAASCFMPKEAFCGEETGNQEDMYQMFGIPYLNWAGLERDSKFRTKSEAVGLCLIHRSYLTEGGGGVGDENPIKTNGGPVLLQNTTGPIAFSPRAIPRQFDTDKAKSWLSYCTEHHRLLCGSEPEPLRDLKVIDCTTLSIENGDQSLAYVALSYVWAKSGDVCGPMWEEGGKKKLPEKLSTVIGDSIEVTKALGYRYLWVDKFCIDQSDADLKHDQIDQMGTIYQNSALTIIGAAGMDETYGLPGVGRRARAQQLFIKYQDLTVIWTPKDPQISIASSHWSSRGWTFQEALLSRRRLVFTDDQVYFECKTMNCFESVHFPLEELHVKNKSKTYEFLRSGVFGRNREQEFGKLVHGKRSLNDSFCRYLSNVEEYSSRDLGYDEDSLNAFKGVLGQFSKEKYSLRHIWGIAYPKNRGVDMNFPRGPGSAGKVQ